MTHTLNCEIHDEEIVEGQCDSCKAEEILEANHATDCLGCSICEL